MMGTRWDANCDNYDARELTGAAGRAGTNANVLARCVFPLARGLRGWGVSVFLPLVVILAGAFPLVWGRVCGGGDRGERGCESCTSTAGLLHEPDRRSLPPRRGAE